MDARAAELRTTDARPWAILALLSVAQFMVVLDITVVNVALPSIGADLGFGRGDPQWVVTAWRELDRNSAIAGAVQLSPEGLRSTHDVARRRVHDLVERGRADGSFRTDLTSQWLVTSFFALMHAAGDEVRAGAWTHRPRWASWSRRSARSSCAARETGRPAHAVKFGCSNAAAGPGARRAR